MFLEILLTVLSVSLAYIIFGVLHVVLRNARAHRFYKEKSPNLPVLTDTNIFNGHLYKTILAYKNCEAFDELHRQYGPTFGFYRYHVPWVATKDIDLIKKIEIDQSYKHIDRVRFDSISDDFDHSIFQVNGDPWRKVRQILAPALNNAKVKSQGTMGLVERVIKQHLEALENKFNDPKLAYHNADGHKSILIDAHDSSSRLTMALTFCLMYRQDDIIDFNAPVERWTRLIHDAAVGIEHFAVDLASMSPMFNQIIRLLAILTPFGKANTKIREFILKAIDLNKAARHRADRIRKKQNHDGKMVDESVTDMRVVDMLCEGFFDKKITHEQLLGSAAFMVTAGFATSADAISHLLWQMARNPDIQEKLRKSIADEGLESEYLNWCIHEALRCHPPVPLGVGRILTEDIQTKSGLVVPKGSFVMPTIYSVHHDENIWPDPDKYDPERWAKRSEFHPAAFLGFGLGPRNCVGSKLAMHEIKMFMQELLLKYRIENHAETSDKFEFRSPGMIWTVLERPIKVGLSRLNQNAQRFNRGLESHI